MTAVNKAITKISHSFEQLVFPIMTQLNFLHLPGTTPSHPAVSCWGGITGAWMMCGQNQHDQQQPHMP